MIGHWRNPGCVAALLIGIAAGPATVSVHAQRHETLTKDDAPLVVDGVVRQVFRSPRKGRIDYLVQIDVDRSEGRKSLASKARLPFPGPGEAVYVHLFQRLDQAGRPIAAESHQGIPAERSQVRVFLAPREQGGWEGAFPDWMEKRDDELAAASPQDPAPSVVEEPSTPPGESTLGMTTETLKVQDKTVFRVVSVERGGAAQAAGLEVGDIIAGVDGAAITDLEQLDAVAAKGEKFSLIVIDVNTGRGVQVEVDPAPQPAATAEAGPKPTAPAQPPKVSLGMSAEPVALGSRSALKVTRVDPAGPAAKAGLEPGDILVAANGAPLTGVEQLLGALRKSGATLKLTVRDSRTGRDAEVEVQLAGTKPTKPEVATTPVAESAGKPSKLGAVTELAFNDDEFAVKVTEVETNSPAAKAGLRPGVLILTANGEPVLHPNELNDAVRRSGGTLKLTIVDPISGKKKALDVELDE